jgi:serine/threonine protein kinase/WD40 repeat protein
VPPTLDELSQSVATFPADQQADQLVDFVCVHLATSWESQRNHRIEDYIACFGPQFSEFRTPNDVPAELIECEFLARHGTAESADHPNVEQYAARFTGRTDAFERLRRLCLCDGRYVLIRRQGQGGLGLVWRAYDFHLERYVAIKEPNPAIAGDAGLVSRLAHEARVTAGLDHPGIVSVHELHEHDRHMPYYVMRLVDGDTLRHWIRDFHREHPSSHRKARRLAWNRLLQSFTDVCEAVAYAHEHNVLHRDLKSDNVIVGKYGETVVLDWGLAKLQTSPAGENGEAQVSESAAHFSGDETPPVKETETTEAKSVVGTLQYMAREQAQGTAEIRSDVFGLGAILYEILTGRPPYERRPDEHTLDLMQRVRSVVFARPRVVSSTVPRPLDAVCMKALAACVDDRYPTATALADDIRHWMADEPVSVCPDRVRDRTARTFRRHTGASIATAVIVILALLGFSFEGCREARRSQLQATENARRAAESARESAIQKLQKIRLTPHRSGWFKDAWTEVRAAARIGVEEILRDEAVATLAGLDAEVIRQDNTFSATHVAFDNEGRRLILGGVQDSPARVWDSETGERQVSQRPGVWPVFWTHDGSPCEVVVEPPNRLAVWNIARNELVQELEFPLEETGGIAVTSQLTRVFATDTTGKRLATALVLADGTETVAVWNVATGKLLLQFAGPSTVLAFSPDSNLLAIGNRQGEISIRSLTSGEVETCLSSERLEVSSLAFGRDVQTRYDDDHRSRWLLAAGDAGGTITVWDVQRGIPRSYCRGSRHHVYDVEFGPDGVTLASCGRDFVRLWDVMTGRNLLDISAHNTMYGLALSPDGGRLAFTSIAIHESAGGVTLVKLQKGRGIASLRGLSGRVTKTWFSHDGAFAAALSTDWRVAVWALKSGNLKYVLQVPQGFFTDSADLCFSQDGTSIAFSSGRTAMMWNTDTGQVQATWPLPPGLLDCIRFQDGKRLLLFRYETQGGKRGPFGDAHPGEHPRVFRLRSLLSEGSLDTIAEIDDFNWHAFAVAAAPDGSTFAAEGLHVGTEGKRRVICAYDGGSGEQLWSVPSPVEQLAATLSIDPGGSLLFFETCTDSIVIGSVVDLRSGVLRQPGRRFGRLSSGGQCVALSGRIWQLEDDKPLFTLSGLRASCQQAHWSRDGLDYITGRPDSSVVVVDVRRVLAELASAGIVD